MHLLTKTEVNFSTGSGLRCRPDQQPSARCIRPRLRREPEVSKLQLLTNGCRHDCSYDKTLFQNFRKSDLSEVICLLNMFCIEKELAYISQTLPLRADFCFKNRALVPMPRSLCFYSCSTLFVGS
jgi:hypothetical protein